MNFFFSLPLLLLNFIYYITEFPTNEQRNRAQQTCEIVDEKLLKPLKLFTSNGKIWLISSSFKNNSSQFISPSFMKRVRVIKMPTQCCLCREIGEFDLLSVLQQSASDAKNISKILRHCKRRYNEYADWNVEKFCWTLLAV